MDAPPRSLTPHIAPLRSALTDALRAWLALPPEVSLEWDDRGRGDVRDLGVRLGIDRRWLDLTVADATPEAAWQRDGLQITVKRPPPDLLRDPAVRALLAELGTRFTTDGSSDAGGEALIAAFDAVHGFASEKISDFHYRNYETSTHGVQGMLRIGFRCNQDCFICPQGRQWPDPPHELWMQWLDEMGAAGVQRLILTGGEPTLYKDLPVLIDKAAHTYGMQVLLQTNAIRFAKRRYVDQLVEAGLELLFISLHSADPAISEALTRAPGTHAKTLQGIDNALDAGLWVGLNCCVEASNVAGLEEHARFIVERFVRQRAYNPVEHVEYSQPGAYYDTERMKSSMVPLDAVEPHLGAALRVLEEAGVQVDCIGTCGFPPCAVRGAPRAVSWRQIAELDEHHLSARQMPETCQGCAAIGLCVGVRREYKEAWGDRGLVAYETLPEGIEVVDHEGPAIGPRRTLVLP